MRYISRESRCHGHTLAEQTHSVTVPCARHAGYKVELLRPDTMVCQSRVICAQGRGLAGPGQGDTGANIHKMSARTCLANDKPSMIPRIILSSVSD